jgi:hypothetical protein
VFRLFGGTSALERQQLCQLGFGFFAGFARRRLQKFDHRFVGLPLTSRRQTLPRRKKEQADTEEKQTKNLHPGRHQYTLLRQAWLPFFVQTPVGLLYAETRHYGHNRLIIGVGVGLKP